MLCCDTMYKAFNKAFSFIKCLTLIIKCVILFSINIYIPNLMPGRCYQKKAARSNHGEHFAHISQLELKFHKRVIAELFLIISYCKNRRL